MPVNPTVRSLAQDGRFSLRDAEALKSAVNAGTVSRSEARDVLNRYAEAIEPEAHAALADAFQQSPRARLSTLPEGFTDQTFERGARGDHVNVLQRALMAAGLAAGNSGMALKSGADGIFGGETERSIQAFQKLNGIAETGVADPVTLRALQQAMAGAAPSASRPATTPATTSPTVVRPSTGLRRPAAAAAAAEGAPPVTAAPTNPATAPATNPTTNPTTNPAAPATTNPATTSPAATPASAPVTTPAAKPAAAPLTTPAATPPAAAVSPTVVALSPGVQPGTAGALIDASTTLATGPRAKNYGTDHAWFNVDPGHAARVDQRMGGLTGRWKCNLFGGNALAAAGFEAPRYGNKTPGEYPVAEDWQKWATPTPEARARATAEGRPIPDYAARSKNPSRFDLQDEVRTANHGTDEEKRARIQQFLDRVQPGDVVTVDHVSAGSDGGHVRVCVGRDPVTNQPMFAQAKQDQARVVAEGVDAFMKEEAMFILRPNTPRASSSPAAVTR